MANSFFKNGDKAYSENLNDGILVGNAFDWTVNVSLPADTGAVFPNSSTIVKGKVADLYITPNSNLSIGSTISNSSGSSQVYRLTVYPNFNRFGGFKSISVTGDCTFYIANKGGTSPIANNLDYTDLSDVPELKVLKEYDIVLTIANNKSVSGLSFVFQSSSADVSGIISQSCVDGLEDDVARIGALETTDSNIYNYGLSVSKYNPNVDENFTVYCKCTDVNGNNVVGKSLTLYKNSESVSSATTNSNGVASWTVNCNTEGLYTYSVGNSNIQVDVKIYAVFHTFGYTLSSVASMDSKSGDITISSVPNDWYVYLMSCTCNYGTLVSFTVKNSTTATITCRNLSDATHNLTGTIVLLYTPSYQLP